MTHGQAARQYDPAETKSTTKRTDAAERMKSAHEAAAYKSWLAKEVQESIDDPSLSVPLWKPAAVADRKRIIADIAQDNPKAAMDMGDDDSKRPPYLFRPT